MTPHDRRPAERTPREDRAGLTIVELLVVIVIILILITLLSPVQPRARPVARRAHCRNNLKQISFALHCYHDFYGSFPPAYIADENGRPMHSWRVLILPFMEQQNLYEEYDFGEPWDGPNNCRLAARGPNEFNCLSNPSNGSVECCFVAVVGPGTIWPGGRAMSLSECSDSPSSTLLVVEIANSGINWMEPSDLDVSDTTLEVNPKHGRGISSRHAGSRRPPAPAGAHVAFVDASVRFLPESTRPEQLRAMLTRSGGESIDLDDATSQGAN